jgi:hypothetical protein
MATAKVGILGILGTLTGRSRRSGAQALVSSILSSGLVRLNLLQSMRFQATRVIRVVSSLSRDLVRVDGSPTSLDKLETRADFALFRERHDFRTLA